VDLLDRHLATAGRERQPRHLEGTRLRAANADPADDPVVLCDDVLARRGQVGHRLEELRKKLLHPVRSLRFGDRSVIDEVRGGERQGGLRVMTVQRSDEPANEVFVLLDGGHGSRSPGLSRSALWNDVPTK